MAPFWKGWSEMVTRGMGQGEPHRRRLQVIVISLMAVVTISAYARSANAQQTMIDWNDRRLTNLENLNLDARLRVVESDMFEVKWLTRTVTATLIGQFILAGISLRRKQ